MTIYRNLVVFWNKKESCVFFPLEKSNSSYFIMKGSVYAVIHIRTLTLLKEEPASDPILKCQYNFSACILKYLFPS